MDPNAALELLRNLAAEVRTTDGDAFVGAAEQLAETFDALDQWLSRGGFPPEAWREGPPAFGEADPRDQLRQVLAEYDENVALYRESQEGTGGYVSGRDYENYEDGLIEFAHDFATATRKLLGEAATTVEINDTLVSVPKDSCEAEHPTRHLQCWGSYGHDGPHSISDDEWGGDEVDTWSSASRQHYIDTGRYLTRAETAEYAD